MKKLVLIALLSIFAFASLPITSKTSIIKCEETGKNVKKFYNRMVDAVEEKNALLVNENIAKVNYYLNISLESCTKTSQWTGYLKHINSIFERKGFRDERN